MSTQPQTAAKNTSTSSAAETSAKGKAPRMLNVIDTTAVDGPRTHEQIVEGRKRLFTFEPGKPLPLEFPIAMKFLRHEAWKAIDDDGKEIAMLRRPKQPEELGAGEKFKLGDDETIARYDELSTHALLQRAVVLPDGEQFAKAETKPERLALIEFIKKVAVAQKRANLSREKDVGDDGFTPEAEVGDDGAAE